MEKSKEGFYYGVDFADGRDRTVELEVSAELKRLENMPAEKVLADMSLIQLAYVCGDL